MSVIYLVRRFSILSGSLRSPLFSVSLLKRITMDRRYSVSSHTSRDSEFYTKLARMQEQFKKSIKVTQLVTQYDELRQVEEDGTYKMSTEAMRDGTRIHNILEENIPSTTLLNDSRIDYIAELVNEVELSEEIKHPLENIDNLLTDPDCVKVLNFVEKLGILAKNASTLNKYSAVRELYMYSMIGGTIVRGIIDGIHVGPKGIVITETKTTKNTEIKGYALRLAYHQALIYHFMLKSLLNAESPILYLLKSFNMESSPIAPLIKQNLNASVEKLREIGMAPVVYLEFLKNRRKGNYEVEIFELDVDQSLYESIITSRMDLIEGKRPLYGFSQAELPENLEIIDTFRDINDFTPAERYGLNLEIE